MRTGFPLTLKAFGQYIKRTGGRGAQRGVDDKCPLTLALRSVQPKTKDGQLNHIGRYTKLPGWALKFISYYDGFIDDDGNFATMSATKAARKVGAIK